VPPNRTVAVELRAKVTDYVSGMRQSRQETKLTADQVLALSKAETQLEGSIAGATQAVKQNGATLDQTTAKGRANRQALDQIAKSTREYRQNLIATGASQVEVAAATERGQAAWLSAASAMGMQEAEAKKLSGTLFAATRNIVDHRAELSALGTTLGVVGAGMLLVAGQAVRTYASFDQAMSSVSSTGDDARASIDKLRDKAIELGADTQYSATEAAQGITEMLKAGVKAQDVLGGGLSGALSLAASDQMSVADAAELTSVALQQFGLEGTQATHVADLLAAGAGKAMGNASDLGLALKYVGPVAHGMNISIEETIGALAAFASQGILADQAGSSLRGVLASLTSPSKAAQAEMKRLGIELYDQNGKFLGLSNVAGQLQKAYDGTGKSAKKATDAEKDMSLGILFGNEQITAARILFAQGSQGIESWTAAVNDAGYAQRQAAEKTNNLSGDIERLGGSIDSAFIRGGGAANQVLRGMAQGAESLVDWVGQLPEPLLSVATMLTGSGGIATLGVAGVAKLGSTVMDARDSFKMLGLSAKTTKLAVAGVGGALALGVLALQIWADEAAAARQRTDNLSATLVVLDGKAVTTAATLKEIQDQFAATRTAGWADWGPTIIDQMKAVGVSAADAQQYVLGNADAIKKVNDQVNAYVAHNGLYATGSGLLVQLDKIKSSMAGSIQSAEDKAKADSEAGVATTSYADALSKTTSATQAASSATQEDTSVLDNWIKAQWAAADAALTLSGSYTGFERMLDTTAASTEKLIKSTKHKTDLTNLDTKAGQDAKDVLDQIATGTLTHVKAMEKAQEPQKKITSEIERGREALVKQARQMGFSEGAISELVAKYELLPENVTTTVGADGALDAQTRVTNLLTAIKKLPKKQRAQIESTFNNKGIEAAENALHAINGYTARPKITPELTTDTLHVKVVRGKSGKGGGGRSDLDSADGNLLVRLFGSLVRQRFADGGGFGQPQVRPFQGDGGVQWGEQGSGPWEAFISGAPQKRDRSIAIWREVGQRLLGSGMSAGGMLQAFADGGITLGHPLSWWQDYLKSDLELTRLKISVRDDKKALAERETYYTGKGKHKKKRSRLKLRGLDRTEGEQQLAEDQQELDLALKAAELNKSKSGTIEARLAAYEAAKTAADDAASAAESTASSIASSASSWASTFQTGSSLADLISNMQSGATQLAQFNDLVGQLKSDGLSSSMSSWLLSQGPSGITLAQQILAGGSDAIAMLNEASGNLNSASTAIATTQETGTYTKSPVLSTVHLPSYVTSGAAGPTAPGSIYAPRSATFNVTSSDPYGAAVIIDQQLRYL